MPSNGNQTFLFHLGQVFYGASFLYGHFKVFIKQVPILAKEQEMRYMGVMHAAHWDRLRCLISSNTVGQGDLSPAFHGCRRSTGIAFLKKSVQIFYKKINALLMRALMLLEQKSEAEPQQRYTLESDEKFISSSLVVLGHHFLRKLLLNQRKIVDQAGESGPLPKFQGVVVASFTSCKQLVHPTVSPLTCMVKYNGLNPNQCLAQFHSC